MDTVDTCATCAESLSTTPFFCCPKWNLQHILLHSHCAAHDVATDSKHIMMHASLLLFDGVIEIDVFPLVQVYLSSTSPMSGSVFNNVLFLRRSETSKVMSFFEIRPTTVFRLYRRILNSSSVLVLLLHEMRPPERQQRNRNRMTIAEMVCMSPINMA